MTAASGVPPVLRPVLEELRGFADAAWRGLASQDRVTAAWAGAMRDAITAALASDAGTPGRARCAMCDALLGEGEARCFTVCESCWDRQYRSTAAPASGAGTPEGEPEYRCLRCQGPIPEDALRMGEFNHCSERCAAPLAESGAAAPPTNAPETSTSLVGTAPDAELDRLLEQCYQRGVRYGRGIWQGPSAEHAGDVAVRESIHAHVARLVDEAEIRGRSAALAVPAPRDASGETARDGDFTVGDPHLNQLLYAFANQWLNVGRAPNGAVAGGYDYSDRMATLGAIQRLYRAAAGEVVGTAELYDSAVGHLHETHPYPRDAMIPVDLMRREKEEG